MHVSYLVCATPRSGSTLLCEGLKATGVAGRPEEYFEALPTTGRPRTPADFLAGLDDPEALAVATRRISSAYARGARRPTACSARR